MRKYPLRLLILIISLFISTASAGENKRLVPVYVYHQQPPYIIDFSLQSGLYFDFVKRLNTLSENYHFEVTSIPRKRAERMLDNHSMDGILLGVSPKWFKDKKETKYLWSSAIFNDSDEVVSLKNKAIEFTNPESLTGMVVGGVRGFYYYGINELVTAKKAKRIDTVNEPNLFTMLLKQRVDVTIISKLTFHYMVKKNDWQNNFYLSAIPHDIYERRILVPRNMEKVFQPLQNLVDKVKQDNRWQKNISRYQSFF